MMTQTEELVLTRQLYNALYDAFNLTLKLLDLCETIPQVREVTEDTYARLKMLPEIK